MEKVRSSLPRPRVLLALVLVLAVAAPAGWFAWHRLSPARAAAPAAARPQADGRACTPAPLAERAARVLVVGLPGVTRADDPLAEQVTRLGVAGVFLAQGSFRSREQVTALTAGLRAASDHPLLVSTDEESGRVAATRPVLGGGPSPRRLARTRDPAAVEAFAADLGRRLRELGIDLDLAPLADLDTGPSGGVIGDRSFGGDVDRTSRYALAFARGLAQGGVAPTLKHFPGQGRSSGDTHTGRATVAADLAALQATDLAPFQRIIDAGAPVVMLNHLDYTALDPALPASLSPAAYALLRRMGFRGVAMTDSLGMGAVNLRWDFPEAVVRAISAGADAALATDGAQALRMRDALVAAVRSGRLPEARLDEAAARVAVLAGADPVALTCTSAPRVGFSGD